MTTKTATVSLGSAASGPQRPRLEADASVVVLLPAPDRAFRSFHLDTEGAVDLVGKEAGSGRPPHT